MDRAVEYYQSLGLGPFESLKRIHIEKKVLGKPINVDDIKMRSAITRVGPIGIELLQPVEGESGNRRVCRARFHPVV